MIDYLIGLINKLPSTKIRVLLTVCLISCTGIVYLWLALHPACNVTGVVCISWEPSSNWLVFLSALAGVDITQYATKSFTSVKHAQIAATVTNTAVTAGVPDAGVQPEEPEDCTSTSDVSEVKTVVQQLKG